MSHARPSSPRRLPALLLVALLLALAGVANATLRAHREAQAAVREGPDSVATLSRRVSSAAWYCPGPLPLGAGQEAASIAVANAGAAPVSGQLLLAGGRGGSTTRQIAVAARSEGVYGLPHTGVSRTGSVTVLLDGGGVGVDELVHGPDGPTVAPCVNHTSPVAYLAPGGSQGADDVELAIYDPGATPAVASVTLATTAGPLAPPALQGLPVQAGSSVLLNLGRAAPGRLLLGTTVSATGGRVVAGGLLTVARGRGLETSLLAASPATATSWTLPPVPAGPGSVEGIAVLNPSARPARVLLESSGPTSGSTVRQEATVPAGGVTSLSPGNESADGSVRFEHLSVTSGAGVVVGRELALTGTSAAPLTASRPRTVAVRRRVGGRIQVERERVVVRVQLRDPLTSLPSLPAGFAAGNGAGRSARSWLLAGGESDRRAGELLEVANPGSRTAKIRLETLAGSAGKQASLPGFSVPAGGTLTVSVAELRQLSGDVALLLVADRPVVASIALYGRGSAKATGFTTALGTPLG